MDLNEGQGDRNVYRRRLTHRR